MSQGFSKYHEWLGSLSVEQVTRAMEGIQNSIDKLEQPEWQFVLTIITSISAVVIAVVSLIFGYRINESNKQHNLRMQKQSLFPYITFDTDVDTQMIKIHNVGLGPAVFKKVIFFSPENKPITGSHSDVHQSLTQLYYNCLDRVTVGASYKPANQLNAVMDVYIYEEDEVIGTSHDKAFIKLRCDTISKEYRIKASKMFFNIIKIELHYESIYGDQYEKSYDLSFLYEAGGT